MDKYMVREFIVPLFYCLFGFSVIYVICDLFGHLARFLSAGPPLRLIFQYYLCMLVLTLEYIIPASLLFAALYCLWQMTRRNELTAMRATGVSLYRAILPLLLIGLLLCIATAVLKETVVPAAVQWTEDFKAGGYKACVPAVHRDRAYYNTAANRLWFIDRLDMSAPHRLEGVTVRQERKDQTKAREITAQRAEWLDGEWWFFGATVQEFHPNESPSGSEKKLWDIAPFRHFPETPTDFQNEVKPWIFLSSWQMVRFLRTHPDLSREERTRKLTDLHARAALPWTCLIVVLFGIPAGSRSHRQSALVGIFVALFCFFAFYGLYVVGMFLAKAGLIQPWLGAWLSNIIFFTAGLHMLFTMR